MMTPRSFLKSGQIYFLTALVGVALRFLWIGDTSFLGDEAKLIQQAFDSNHEGYWPNHGLMGTRGVVYGPMAVWIYKIFLWATQDLLKLTLLKACWDTVMLACGMALLRRGGLRFSRAWWLLPVLSPYLWFYSRQLWDNGFLPGFSVITVGATLCFLTERRFRFLFLACVGMAASLNTHLMGTALVAGVVLAVGITAREDLFKSPGKAVLSFLPFFLVVPYFAFLLTQSPESTPWRFSLQGLDGSFLGARLLGFARFGRYFIDLGHGLPRSEAWLTFPGELVSFGMILVSGWGIVRVVRSPSSPLRTVLMSVLACQVALSFYKNIHLHPHYFNAVWPVFWIFIGEGFEAVTAWRPKLGRVIAVIPFCLLAGLIQVQLLIHHNEGMRSEHFGPSASQWRRIYLDSIGPIQFEHYSHLPWSRAMEDIFGVLKSLDRRTDGRLSIEGGSEHRKIELKASSPHAGLEWR